VKLLKISPALHSTCPHVIITFAIHQRHHHGLKGRRHEVANFRQRKLSVLNISSCPFISTKWEIFKPKNCTARKKILQQAKISAGSEQRRPIAPPHDVIVKHRRIQTAQ